MKKSLLTYFPFGPAALRPYTLQTPRGDPTHQKISCLLLFLLAFQDVGVAGAQHQIHKWHIFCWCCRGCWSPCCPRTWGASSSGGLGPQNPRTPNRHSNTSAGCILSAGAVGAAGPHVVLKAWGVGVGGLRVLGAGPPDFKKQMPTPPTHTHTHTHSTQHTAHHTAHSTQPQHHTTHNHNTTTPQHTQDTQHTQPQNHNTPHTTQHTTTTAHHTQPQHHTTTAHTTTKPQHTTHNTTHSTQHTSTQQHNHTAHTQHRRRRKRRSGQTLNPGHQPRNWQEGTTTHTHSTQHNTKSTTQHHTQLMPVWAPHG